MGGYLGSIGGKISSAAKDPLKQIRGMSGQVSKGYTGIRDDITGKDGSKKDSAKLQAEQKAMYEKLGGYEGDITAAEQAGYNRMADPALGIEAEAKSRMTMAQAQDPNNPVALAFRNFYDQQAQGEGKKGLADVGVLSALGAQAMQGQMGGGMPMTVGGMQALQSQTQNQSGQAFANVQKRMQGLRDQGIAQGWAQTDKSYGRGQDALNRYGGLSQMQTDIGTGHAQRQSALASGESGALQQTLAQQIQARAMGNQAMWQGAAGTFLPMTQAGSIIGGQQMANAPAASTAQYTPYTQGRQVG